MTINWIAIVAAAFSALIVGFIWYNPKVMGTIWMKEAGLDEEKIKGGNMAAVLGMAFVYSFFIALVLRFLVVHQTGALGMIGGSETNALPSYTAFMADYGTAFRTFKHGALHGFLTGLLFITPTIGVNKRA